MAVQLIRPTTKILLATPCHSGYLHTLVVDAMWNAMMYAYSKIDNLVIDRFYLTRCMVDRARQQAHEKALAEKYDYILFWDDDILAPKETIAKLLSHNKDIVAGLMCRRTWPFNIYAYNQEPGGDLMDFDSYKSLTAQQVAVGGLIEVHTTSTGCMLLRPEVVGDMKPPYWVWPKTAAEDVNFCANMVKRGKSVFVDADIKLVHLGFDPQFVDVNTHINSMKQMQKLIEQKPEIKNDPEWFKISYMVAGA